MDKKMTPAQEFAVLTIIDRETLPFEYRRNSFEEMLTQIESERGLVTKMKTMKLHEGIQRVMAGVIAKSDREVVEAESELETLSQMMKTLIYKIFDTEGADPRYTLEFREMKTALGIYQN